MSRPTIHTLQAADGATIGYRQIGEGPGILIVNGGMRASEHYLHLARLLADSFTVYLPDRRGRHLSAAPTPDYGMATELQDMSALLKATGAQFVMGHSAGALITLEAALAFPQIKKIAVYEPPLAINHSISTKIWVSQFDQEIHGRKYAAAMETSLFGLGLLPPEAAQLPRAARVLIMRILMLKDWLVWRPGYTKPGDLVATQKLDIPLVEYMDGTLSRFGTLNKPTLLLGGGKTPTAFLKDAIAALHETLPHHELNLFPGLEHTSPTTRAGAIQIAPVVRKFFLSR